jgi:predicted NUDIX family phosphoesterase
MSKMCLCYRPNPQVGPFFENWELFLKPRAEVDDPTKLDPTIQQILPYTTIFRQVVREVDGVAEDSLELLSYKRADQGTEKQLIGMRSVGMGGHMDKLPDEDQGILQLIYEEAKRELVEEIRFKVKPARLHASILNAARHNNLIAVKDRNPVDSVHTAIGILVNFDEHPGNENLIPEAGHIEDLRWIDISAITPAEVEGYETWSQIVIQGMQRNLSEFLAAKAQHIEMMQQHEQMARKQQAIDAVNLAAEESDDKAPLLHFEALSENGSAFFDYDHEAIRLEVVEGQEGGTGFKLHAKDRAGPAKFAVARGGVEYTFFLNIAAVEGDESQKLRVILVDTQVAPFTPPADQLTDSTAETQATDSSSNTNTDVVNHIVV